MGVSLVGGARLRSDGFELEAMCEALYARGTVCTLEGGKQLKGRSFGFFLLAWLTACGGATGGPEGAAGSSPIAGVATGGDTSAGGGSGTVDGSGGRSPTGGVESTGGLSNEYVEPACPDREPPPVEQECDPLEPESESECRAGYGCYPYLEYPYGEKCGFPQYGAECALASTGAQGDSCGNGYGYCEPGYMCVVGTGAGARCARLCPLTTPTNCPSGLICTETDVKGYGVCF